MAELTKPQYSNPKSYPSDRKVYPVQSARTDFTRPSGVPDQMFAVANVFEALAKGIKENQLANEKSQQTANRLQAKDLIVRKMKHHRNLMTKLSMNLDKTAPEHLVLNDLVDKIGDRDGLGETQLYLGENLDVRISPMMLPDGLNEEVSFLTEEAFIRMDTELLSKLIQGVNGAQTKHDKNYLTREQDIYAQKVITTFRNADSTGNAIEQSKIHLANIFASILERQIQGGTLDAAEVETEKYQSIQTMLQAWYVREMRDPDIRRDEVIKRAEEGHYKIKIEGKKYGLSPSYYNADTLKKNERNERKFINDEEKNRINEIKKNFQTFQRDNTGANFKGYDQSYKELTDMEVEPYEAIKWISDQEIEARGISITAIENDIWSKSQFNKGELVPFTKQGTLVDQYGNKKLISLKGKELADAVKAKYPDAGDDVKWITEGYITRLITAHEVKVQQESAKELSGKQNTVLAGLANEAIQPLGSGKVLDKFYFLNQAEEWELDYSKIKNDKSLISVFGKGDETLDQKIQEIEKIGRVAIGVHKAYMKSLAPRDITDEQHPSILESIANEYNRNAGPAIARAEQQPKERDEIDDPYTEASDQLEEDELWGHHRSPDAGKSNKTEHLLLEHLLEEDLQGMLKVAQNIINLDRNGLKDAIDYLNEEHPVNSLNRGTRDQVIQAINARQIKLRDHAAMTAIIESRQSHMFAAGKPINVDFIYQWQKQYGAGSITKLIPQALLDTVAELGDPSIDKATRYGKYQQLINITKQFGKSNTQRVAYQELRGHIKKNVSSSLAALSDVWDTVDLGRREELFGITSGTYSSTADSEGGRTPANTEIKEAITKRGKLIGITSTLQDTEQQSDHITLQRDIVRAFSMEKYFEDKSPKEIADTLNDMLYGQSHVVETGQRYNFQVDDAPYEAIGLTSEDDAENGYKHYMYEMEFTENPASWTPISGLHPRILEQLRDQALQSSMMTNMGVGKKRYREMKDGEYTGKIIEENIKTGERKEIFVDAFSIIQAQSIEQISEDVLRANSENLRKGFINSTDGGFNIGVYLVGPDGNINQSMLIGKFFQVDGRGRKTDIVVSQEELAAYSASPYILNFLNGAKFILNFDHQYIKDLKKEGADKILNGTMAPRISGTPFLRFLEKAGKLEFDHAILPLHNAMEKKAKELGVELLNRKQAEAVLDELIGRQNRWYKTPWMPEFMKRFLGSFTNLGQQTSLRDLKERLDPDLQRLHGRKP